MPEKRKITSFKTKRLLFVYYEIENTIDEYHSEVSDRYLVFEAAREDLKNHCDWYSDRGTGMIYKIEIFKIGSKKISIERTLVFKRTQRDILKDKYFDKSKGDKRI